MTVLSRSHWTKFEMTWQFNIDSFYSAFLSIHSKPFFFWFIRVLKMDRNTISRKSVLVQCNAWHITHETRVSFNTPTNYESFAFSYRPDIYFYFYAFLISFCFKIVDHHYRWPTFALIQIFNQFQCSQRWTVSAQWLKKVHKICQRWKRKAQLVHWTNFEIRNDMH